jgi:Ni,Fe-hydrogenase III small subunit
MCNRQMPVDGFCIIAMVGAAAPVESWVSLCCAGPSTVLVGLCAALQLLLLPLGC